MEALRPVPKPENLMVKNRAAAKVIVKKKKKKKYRWWGCGISDNTSQFHLSF